MPSFRVPHPHPRRPRLAPHWQPNPPAPPVAAERQTVRSSHPRRPRLAAHWQPNPTAPPAAAKRQPVRRFASYPHCRRMCPRLQRAGRAELRQLRDPWKHHLRRANPGRRAKERRRWPARSPPGSRTRGRPMRNPASPRNRYPQAGKPRHELQRSLDQRKTKVRSRTFRVSGPGHSRRSPRSKSRRPKPRRARTRLPAWLPREPRRPLMPVGPEVRRRRRPPRPATGSRRRQTVARIRQGCSPETAETHR
jgi:hypothetical protein